MNDPEADGLEFEELSPFIPFGTVLAMTASVLVGVVGAVVIVPRLAPDLASSLFGEAPKAYWYLSRASAFAAFVLLWLSMALGILITNKLARVWPGGPTAFDLHQFTSLLGLNLVLFHALILLGDRYIDYRLDQVLLPFRSVNYQPAWVGLGQLGFYMLIPVALSFYVRRNLGRRLWSMIHYLSFACFIMALTHGLLSGTDSSSVPVLALYVAAGVSILFLSVHRLLVTLLPRAPARRSRRS